MVENRKNSNFPCENKVLNVVIVSTCLKLYKKTKKERDLIILATDYNVIANGFDSMK